MSELNERLLLAQAELKAPKGQFNSFGKYKYRSSEDILEGVKPVNKKHELTLTLSDEPVLIGDWHYIKATAKLVHKDESVEVHAYARESQIKKGMDDSQITGTASSYARKYALNGLYLIDDTKDADTDENRNQSDNKPVKKVSAAKVKALNGLVESLAEKVDKTPNETLKTMLDTVGLSHIKKLEELDEDQAGSFMIELNKWNTKYSKK